MLFKAFSSPSSLLLQSVGHLTFVSCDVLVPRSGKENPSIIMEVDSSMFISFPFRDMLGSVSLAFSIQLFTFSIPFLLKRA